MNFSINYISGMVLTLLILFPYVGIVPGIDVQPNFLLVAPIVLVILYRSLEPWVLIILLSCLFLGTLRLVTEEFLTITKLVIVYVASILTPALIAFSLKKGIINLSEKMVYTCLTVYLFVAFVQLIYPEFLSFLVSRDNVAQLLSSGRGVKSLTGEPSSFGRLIIIFNVLIVYIGASYKIANLKKLLAISLVLIFLNVALSQSFYAFAIHGVIIALLSYLTSKKIFVAFSLAAFFGMVSVFLFVDSDSRFVFILKALVDNPDIIFSQGAMRRVFNVPISLLAAYEYGLLGAGFNPQGYLSSSFPFFGYDIPFMIAGRNLGGFVEFYLRLGLLAVPFIFFYFYMLYRISTIRCICSDGNKRIGVLLALSVFLMTFIDGSPSDPVKWLLLLFLYFESYNNTAMDGYGKR